MKKLNITKEQFNRSRYFKNKYGELEYVSESGDIYKTSKGKVLKFMKESVESGKGSGVGITCKIAVEGDSPEEVLQNLHDKLLSLDATITDGNENPNPKIVEKYYYWDKENGGDVMFNIKDPRHHLDGVHCEIYSGEPRDGW